MEPVSAWPFVTVPEFEALCTKTLSRSQALQISLVPLITRDQKTQWESYAQEHQSWVQEGLDVRHGGGESHREKEDGSHHQKGDENHPVGGDPMHHVHNIDTHHTDGNTMTHMEGNSSSHMDGNASHHMGLDGNHHSTGNSSLAEEVTISR